MLDTFRIPDFRYACGLVSDVQVAFRSLNPGGSKGTVLVTTCFGGRVDKTLTFKDGALRDYHIVVAAMLGNGESSSPSNDDSFPADYALRYEASNDHVPDCVKSQYTLLSEHLGVKRLEAVLGFSMGGQQAYYWAVMHGTGPDPFLKRAVVICGSAKTSGLNYSFLEGPVSALIASHDYDHGRYKEKGVNPADGLRAFGRAYAAWVPSAEWFRQELWRSTGAQSLRDWLHPPIGTTSYEKWDPEDLIVKVRMWQAGDIGTLAGDGDYRAALRGITASVLLMPGATDQYFSADDSKTEMGCLAHGELQIIPSIWGHMAGGGRNPDDVRWMDQRLSAFMAAPLPQLRPTDAMPDQA